jgi:membrane protein CcdC involved in cytochrome C biogenesis
LQQENKSHTKIFKLEKKKFLEFLKKKLIELCIEIINTKFDIKIKKIFFKKGSVLLYVIFNDQIIEKDVEKNLKQL